jgi:hypothetical protein
MSVVMAINKFINLECESGNKFGDQMYMELMVVGMEYALFYNIYSWALLV